MERCLNCHLKFETVKNNLCSGCREFISKKGINVDSPTEPFSFTWVFVKANATNEHLLNRHPGVIEYTEYEDEDYFTVKIFASENWDCDWEQLPIEEKE